MDKRIVKAEVKVLYNGLCCDPFCDYACGSWCSLYDQSLKFEASSGVTSKRSRLKDCINSEIHEEIEENTND